MRRERAKKCPREGSCAWFARDGASESKPLSREGLAVLVPDPKTVRGLLTRYASLRIALAERNTPERARELEDVSYTLCVMTGTRTVSEAVQAADALLVAGTGRDTARRTDGESGLPMAV
ncbi:DUF5133 domain-containing protein [Streptomyces sp. NPDC002513]